MEEEPKPRVNYTPFISVIDKEDARIIGKEGLFEVLMEVYESGTRGATAKKIAEKLNISMQSLYNHLETLTNLRAIDARTAREVRKKTSHPGRPKGDKVGRGKKMGKVFYESCDPDVNVLIGEPVLDGNLNDTFEDIAIPKDDDNRTKEEQETREILRGFSKATTAVLEHFLPKLKNHKDKVWPTDKICPFCEVNHDGREFIRAIVLRIAMGYLNEAERYEQIMEKYNFCTKKAEKGLVHGRVLTT